MRTESLGITAATQSTVQVVATTSDGTEAALRAGAILARGAGARLVVVVPHIVPYPIDLDSPTDSTAFFVKRYQDLARRLGSRAEVFVCLCRRLDDVVAAVAHRDAITVIGGPCGRWLTSPEERFANCVVRHGGHVLFASCGPNHTQRRRPPSLAAALLTACMLVVSASPAFAQARPTNEELLRRIDALEAQLSELRAQLQAALPSLAPSPSSPSSDAKGAAAAELPIDLKVGASLDTYYGFNFNRPIGRVNLLRAYDVTGNNFALNQASLVLERSPEPEAGKRLGGRVDLQYGQATETLQGSLANEPRPWVYRNVFQAYGTYVAPVGRGLTIDFGKWASALGIESNYTKDQINYSRSYWFNFLPFYHMGARLTYKPTDAVALNYWITNGTQQTEAFNNFKDQFVGAVLQPSKALTWNVQYYLGQEHPDVQPITVLTAPSLPTQPGLSVTPVESYFRGKLHVFDSYLTWQASPGTTVALEADRVISRNPGGAADSTVSGGAAYVKRRVTPKTAVAARAEYIRDQGGLFTGRTQSVKETTATFDYQPADGFLARAEWRRDSSDQPFFLSHTAGDRRNSQQTLTLGLMWWWGTKREAW